MLRANKTPISGLALAGALLSSSIVQAGQVRSAEINDTPLANQVLACLAEPEESGRLACYDALARRLADDIRARTDRAAKPGLKRDQAKDRSRDDAAARQTRELASLREQLARERAAQEELQTRLEQVRKDAEAKTRAAREEAARASAAARAAEEKASKAREETEDNFGKNRRADKPDEIKGTVTQIRSNGNWLRFRLDNGQVWGKDSGRTLYFFKEGVDVTIRRGLAGGHLLTVDGKNGSMKVDRKD